MASLPHLCPFSTPFQNVEVLEANGSAPLHSQDASVDREWQINTPPPQAVAEVRYVAGLVRRWKVGKGENVE
jgi:hypothetical protein